MKGHDKEVGRETEKKVWRGEGRREARDGRREGGRQGKGMERKEGGRREKRERTGLELVLCDWSYSCSLKPLPPPLLKPPSLTVHLPLALLSSKSPHPELFL